MAFTENLKRDALCSEFIPTTDNTQKKTWLIDFQLVIYGGFFVHIYERKVGLAIDRNSISVKTSSIIQRQDNRHEVISVRIPLCNEAIILSCVIINPAHLFPLQRLLLERGSECVYDVIVETLHTSGLLILPSKCTRLLLLFVKC